MKPPVELLKNLVAIDSVNPDLVPGGHGEGEIARFIADWLKSVGLEVEIDEVAPGRPNVIGRLPGRGGGRSLLLCGHIDTVGVAQMESPHSPRIEGNRLYGRGAYDMKGGLAAMLTAAATVREHTLAGDVFIAAVADEEFGSLGMMSVARRLTADAAILTEPTSLKVCIAHKGFAWADIETRGRAAHGSKPELGIDAITRMAPILVGLDQLDRTLRTGVGDAILGTGSVHASTISGGQERSSYPAACVVTVERRIVPGETAAQFRRELEGLLGIARQVIPDLEADFTLGLSRDPFRVDVSEEIVATLLKQASIELGKDTPVYGESWWMDSALLASAGIPTAVFGPGGGGAHEPVEWADLDQLQPSIDILVATVMAFCGSKHHPDG